MFIYANHLGGYFVSEKKLSDKERTCDCCNDVDILAGIANDREEAIKLLEPYKYHGHNNNDINELINKYWPMNHIINEKHK